MKRKMDSSYVKSARWVLADDAATFTSVPALAEGVKGYKVLLSADGKEIKVLSKGFILIVR